jgi:hypothetical protein
LGRRPRIEDAQRIAGRIHDAPEIAGELLGDGDGAQVGAADLLAHALHSWRKKNVVREPSYNLGIHRAGDVEAELVPAQDVLVAAALATSCGVASRKSLRRLCVRRPR